MKNSNPRASLALRLLAATTLCVLVAGCSSKAEEAPKADAQKSADSKSGPAKAPGGPGAAVPARVLQVEPRRQPIRLESVAQVEGSKEVEVRPRVGGILLKRLYNEGDPVKAGAVLFQIDPTPFEITLAQQRAALAQERARNEQARREAARLKELADQRAISQREYDDATSTLKLSDASIQAAEARVREAELNVSYTRVTAPVGGVSGRAARSEGSLVGTADVLTTISQITPVWVRFALAESEVSRLPGSRVGPDADIRLILGDGSRYPGRGRINFSESRVDARTGTRQMRAEFDNPGGQLLPGQFVRVEVSVNRTQPVFLVPQAAVIQNERGHIVFTLDAENKVAPRPIRVGEWVGSDWTVLEGLKQGDRVVVDNLMKMQPGIIVQPVQEPSGDAKAPQPGAAEKGAPDKGPAPAPATKATKK